MKKKISIIIPVYNVENYLRQCIESILEQEYEEKEIILVDDGSTDNSGSICDEYADKYENVLVIHKENGGLSDARNVGLAKAAGEYVLFVDSDDFVEENSLSPIVEIVNANPVDVVLLEAQKYYADGTNIPMCDGISKEMVYKKAKKDILNSISKCPKYPASACSKLIRRELISEDIFFEKGLLSEDLDWSMKLFLKANTFDYCDTVYYNYRQNRVGSITNTINPKKVDDMLYILEKWSRIAETKNVVEKNFILSQMAYELPIIIYLYSRLKKEKTQFKCRIKKLLFLLNHRAELKYKCTKLLCSMVGIYCTSLLINAVYKK